MKVSKIFTAKFYKNIQNWDSLKRGDNFTIHNIMFFVVMNIEEEGYNRLTILCESGERIRIKAENNIATVVMAI